MLLHQTTMGNLTAYLRPSTILPKILHFLKKYFVFFLSYGLYKYYLSEVEGYFAVVQIYSQEGFQESF